MRTCFNCNGKGEVIWCEDEPPTTCTICEGTGECEDFVIVKQENLLNVVVVGGWDDVDPDDWYGYGYDD